MLCFQALRNTVEPVLGPFIDSQPPQEGERIQVIVKHLCTPNEVTTGLTRQLAHLPTATLVFSLVNKSMN